MSWIGAGIGALFGAQRGGILGGVVGAVIGNWVEGKAREMMGSSASGQSSASGGELATLAALAAMLSKLAKADGRITEDEVRCSGRRRMTPTPSTITPPLSRQPSRA